MLTEQVLALNREALIVFSRGKMAFLLRADAFFHRNLKRCYGFPQGTSVPLAVGRLVGDRKLDVPARVSVSVPS
jgi:hypothetical protein